MLLQDFFTSAKPHGVYKKNFYQEVKYRLLQDRKFPIENL